MVAEWQSATIKEVAEKVAIGPFGSSIKVETFVQDGVPIISGQHLCGTRLEDNEYNFITVEHADQLANANVQRGDVIFTHAGNIGQVAYIPKTSRFERYIISQRQFYLRPNAKQVLSEFVTYYFKTAEGQHKLLANATPSGVPSIAQPVTYLRTIEIPLPPLSEQKTIAHILGSLDDKIELNRRMNETLEGIARAIFKSWFIDFEPFRDQGMQDSPLGEIPKGWRVGTLGEFSSLNPETWSKETRPSVINYVDLSNTKWGRIESVTVYTQEDAPSRAQRVLRPRDTIIGTVRPGNGSYAFISEDGLTGSTGFAVLRPLRAEYAEFVYFAATAGENIEALSHLADGGAYPAVRPEVVAATQVVRPSGDVLMRFSRVTGPLLDKMAGNERESRTLATLRDALLPKLISGELRVKDADKFIPKEETKTVGQVTSAIYTIGHSNHSIQSFITLLKRHNITAVADVRSSPVSQHYPQFNQGALSAALKKENISYVFMGKELGGRPDDPRCYANGQANYLKMAETPIFKEGINRLLKGKDQNRIVLLCAEKEPLDCHRTILISRNLYKLGIPIKHILADGSIEEHQDTEHRLIKVTGLEPNLFDRSSSDSERIQQAYDKRAREIAYKPSHKEDEYEYAE